MKPVFSPIMIFLLVLLGLLSSPFMLAAQAASEIEQARITKAAEQNGAVYAVYFGIMALITLCAILLSYTRKLRNAALKKQELMLRNITNNIDGGVLVQEINGQAKVVYINDGLLKMLQYSREEFLALDDQYYHTRFVCAEDLSQLKAQFHKAATSESGENSFSFHLRLRQRDGNLLPVLLNCSFVDGILYCVMMDNSREHAIIAELEYEQERFRVLFDKSDEILYEVDFVNQTFQMSKRFREKFGWEPPTHYWGENLPELFHFYEDDKPILLDMFAAINSGVVDGECKIRIYNDKFTPRWCKVIYHVLKKDGKNYRLFGKLTDIDAEMKEKESLLRKAEIDGLTGIYNKATFRSRCVEYLSKSPEAHVAVLFTDVDNFKETNDNFGHAAGDKILRDFAEKLQEIFTQDDILGRFGGDEFCVLMKDTNRDALLPVLQRLVQELRGEYINDQHIVNVSASVGAVLSDEFGLDFESLLDEADKALYFAKENGKNTYMLYHEGICLKGCHGRGTGTAFEESEEEVKTPV